jgi:hypothetical protein
MGIVRWRKATAAVVASCIGVAVLWAAGPARIASQRLLGDTAEARVEAYLAAVGRGDRAAALGRWPSTPLVATQDERAAAHQARRHQVTDELLALSATRSSHQLLGVQWWCNCWEPLQPTAPSGAGAARFHVKITSAHGETRRYTFDLITHRTDRAALRHVFVQVYDGYEPVPWLDPLGFVYRRLVDAGVIQAWRIVDVYPAEETPLVFPCAGP